MKTILLGLDGATFTILDPLVSEGVMPCLKRLLARGSRCGLWSTSLHLTPVAWTSMTTGQLPGNHGIFDFFSVTQLPGTIYRRLFDSRDIQCESIWRLVSRHRRTITALNFPVTYPAPSVNGVVIPGFVSTRILPDACRPRGIFQKLNTALNVTPSEIAWDMEKEQLAVNSLPHDDYEGWIRFHIHREQRWFEILRHLMLTQPSDLTAIVFDGVDKLQHLAWRMLDPELLPRRPSRWERTIRNLCLEYFRRLDCFIGDIVALAGSECRIFLASDHGFRGTSSVFHLNIWLEQHGYLRWADRNADTGAPDQLFATQSKSQLFDWSGTVAFAANASSNGIHVRVMDDSGEPCMDSHQYEELCRRLISELLQYRDPATGEPVVEKVMTRVEAFPGPCNQLAPDLTLVLRDKGFISVLPAETPVRERAEVKGMHDPRGVLIAVGPGIREGVQVNDLDIVDVCPALLYSLDLPVPADLDGKLPQDLFEPAYLDVHRARASEECVRRTVSAFGNKRVMSDEDTTAICRSLQALGYLE